MRIDYEMVRKLEEKKPVVIQDDGFNGFVTFLKWVFLIGLAAQILEVIS